MNEYGIGSLTPNKISIFQRNLERKIEDQFNLIGNRELSNPSHITLKYPFHARDIIEVEQVLHKYSATQAKTKWAVRGFNYFQNERNFVIFMDVIPSPATRDAHARLIKALQQIEWIQWLEFDTAEMHYHITLAHKGLTINNFETVWSFVNQQDPPEFNFFFDHIALVKIERGISKVYKQYWLRNDVPS